MKQFYKGQFVIYDNTYGYVNFISEEYITICVREYTKPSAEAGHALSAIRQVCVCVFPNDWDKVLDVMVKSKLKRIYESVGWELTEAAGAVLPRKLFGDEDDEKKE